MAYDDEQQGNTKRCSTMGMQQHSEDFLYQYNFDPSPTTN